MKYRLCILVRLKVGATQPYYAHATSDFLNNIHLPWWLHMKPVLVLP